MQLYLDKLMDFLWRNYYQKVLLKDKENVNKFENFSNIPQL